LIYTDLCVCLMCLGLAHACDYKFIFV
jgi:hypothetical protein